MGLVKFFTGDRVAVATVFLAITLVSIIAGGAALAIFLSVLIYLGSKEYVAIVKAKGFDPCFALIIIVDFLLILLASLELHQYLGLIISFGVIASFLVILFRGYAAKTADVATTVLGFLYGGWLPAHIILLRKLNATGLHLWDFHFRDGLGYIILIFFIITISDIAGYYIGKNFGKTPLWQAISPKKTKEGSIASTIGGVLISIVVGKFIGLHLAHSIIAGLIFTLTAQFGDLSESMMKRDAGVKDSGKLLPGHGGVLDRADSYIFTGAVAYYYFKIFVLHGSLFLGFLSNLRF